MLDERIELVDDHNPELDEDFGLADAVREHLDKEAHALPPDLAAWIKRQFDAYMRFGPWDAFWDELAPHYRLEAAKRCDEMCKFEVLHERFERDKVASGRYTLDEAARLIATAGERLSVIVQMLCAAAEQNTLPVYSRWERVRFTPTADDSVSWRHKEAYWDDLNRWLQTNEPRIAVRFPEPTANTGESTGPEKSNRPKLTDGQREVIGRRAANGEKQADLAAEFGVSRPAISKILARWKESHRPRNSPFSRPK